MFPALTCGWSGGQPLCRSGLCCEFALHSQSLLSQLVQSTVATAIPLHALDFIFNCFFVFLISFLKDNLPFSPDNSVNAGPRVWNLTF